MVYWLWYGSIEKLCLTQNFVGSLQDASVRAIISTLLVSFDSCRAFHDPFDAEQSPSNMVSISSFHPKRQAMFCSASEINFRKPGVEEFFGSTLREQVLSTFTDFEIYLPENLGSESDRFGEILVDSYNVLHDLQRDTALEDWRMMRKFLPEEVWINY
jgi:hypothetical protein